MGTLHVQLDSDELISVTHLHSKHYDFRPFPNSEEYGIEVLTKRTLLHPDVVKDSIYGPRILYSINYNDLPEKYIPEAKDMLLRYLKDSGIVISNYLHSEEL